MEVSVWLDVYWGAGGEKSGTQGGVARKRLHFFGCGALFFSGKLYIRVLMDNGLKIK